MIKVGLGVTVLSKCMSNNSVDGIGQYTQSLRSQLLAHDAIEITPFSFKSKIPVEVADGSDAHTLHAYPLSALCSSTTFLPFLGSRRLRHNVDIVHATDHLIPNMGSTPVVATLMDAIPISQPQWVSYRYRTLKNLMWRRASRWAAHIITISEYSKAEIATNFGIQEDKISVIPLAVDMQWFESPPKQIMNKVRTELALPEKYYLFVGTLQPRKNIERVIAAHRALPAAIQSECPLLIVGRDGWGCEKVVNALKSGEYGNSVRWLRYVDRNSLKVITQLSSALVFPSLHEGFGLPVLEAMAAGSPVVTSNTTSLPEVAGDAALLVDPLDSHSIAQAMLNIVEDDTLANSLIQKGFERARQFSWEETAKQTVNVYQKVLTS